MNSRAQAPEERSGDSGQGGAPVNATIEPERDLPIPVDVFPRAQARAIRIGDQPRRGRDSDVTKRA
jgi:hypothetical protein